jgi:hypothetical protein
MSLTEKSAAAAGAGKAVKIRVIKAESQRVFIFFIKTPP